MNRQKHIPRPKPGRGISDYSFDREAFYYHTELGQNIREMRKMYDLYPDWEMHPAILKFWEQKGIKKELFEIGTEKDIWKYSVFTRFDIDKTKKYPLIMVHHGGGESCFGAEFYGFNHLMEKEEFICVYPEPLNKPHMLGGEPLVEDGFKLIMDKLNEEYPIESSQVYVTGFSRGSNLTESIATMWPDKVAAVGPCPGPNSFRNSLCYTGKEYYEKAAKYHMPIICIAGCEDVEDHFPFDFEIAFENFNIWMKEIAGVANYVPTNYKESRVLISTTKNSVEKAFGIKFDHDYTLRLEDTDWLIGEFCNQEGVVVAKMICVVGRPHIHASSDASLLWKFFRQFRRDLKTGESIFQPSTE